MNSRSLSQRGSAIAALLVSALLLSGCSVSAGSANKPTSNSKALISDADCKRNAAAGTITYISGYGYSASAGQMDVFIAQELGYFKNLCLDVEINASGANGQQLVSSGKGQFTELGSAEDVLMAAANSKNLTAVATYGTTSPFCIFANKDIKKLADLRGKKLGYFINLTPVAAAMLNAVGLSTSDVDLIKMTSYDPTVVTRGQIDAVVGYASNQCATLRAMGESFTEFLPSQFDLDGTYNVMEVNSEFLKQHRSAASDFMRAELKALKHCLDDEADCVKRITALAAKNNQGQAFPLSQQARTWKIESQWVRESAGVLPGVQTEAAWKSAAETVKKYGSVTTIPPLKNVVDFALVKDLYSGGKLVWPGGDK